jgi:hypothetical protein
LRGKGCLTGKIRRGTVRPYSRGFRLARHLPDRAAIKKSGGFERDALCRVDVRELLPPVAQIKKHVAGSYAPVTILIDERPDGVHLSYDRMASFLAPYENSEALKVAKDLDAKVEALLAVAGS